MKILILACLVALALAREKEEINVSNETVERLSNNELDSSREQKLQKFKHEEQQQREVELQDKIDHFVQQQPVVYPYTEPLSYAILPQNILPLAQPPVALPFLQPEKMEVLQTKETIFPKLKVMPSLKSPVVPFSERQILNPTYSENLRVPLHLIQPLMHQVPQSLLQTPMLLSQPELSPPQSEVPPFPQQVVPYSQRDTPVEAFLLYQEPLRGRTGEFYPVPQPIAPVYNAVIV
ncbi:PREDICTED: beta-casein [Ceratotherium simum simum]|uniref:Beta-casein n=1 Tax=Ceratotherium simum simum TaxID=73337 RepID=A0ABM0H4C1_CERSS|nr:PREDICTED: beta-casein [Ceratotherium simum simum]